METVTIPLQEYNILLNYKKNNTKSTMNYRNSEKGKRANALAQKRFREKKKAQAQ